MLEVSPCLREYSFHMKFSAALAFTLALCFAKRDFAASTVMTAWSGSDGPFINTTVNGYAVHQAADQGGGNWAGFMYFQRPGGVNFASGSTLYMEVDYVDVAGDGAFGVQYNAVGNAFQSSGFGFNHTVHNTGVFKTA